MEIKTINADYEYRIVNILKEYLADKEVDPSTLQPDMLDKALWNGMEQLGQLLYDDIFEWMSEEDWIKALQGKS